MSTTIPISFDFRAASRSSRRRRPPLQCEDGAAMIPRLDRPTDRIQTRARAGRRGRRFARLAVAALFALGFAACSREPASWTTRHGARASGSADASAPDILVVLVDALRADHLSCYGYARPTSPSLDRWAQGAALYTRAYTGGTHTRIS